MPFLNILTIFAREACYDTVLFGKVCDDCKGGAIMGILAIVLRVLTAGIVVAATIGIIWAGALIMTARDDVSQRAKGIKRIQEVVIGLAGYALLAGFISFISPKGDLNTALNPTAVVPCQVSDKPTTPTSPVHGTPTKPSWPSTPLDPSDPSGPSDSGTVSKSDLPIGPLTSSSDNIDCDPRTTFYKKYSNAHVNGKKISVTLCKVPNISGSNIVNSRVSGAYYALAAAYKKDTGKTLSASSSFRSYEDQMYFYNCYITKSCNGGNLAAKPGRSKHEGGYAIDFNVPSGSTSVQKITSCASTSGFGSVTDRKSPNRWYYTELSRWFCNNLGKYGMTRPVKNEVWHVNPTSKYL